MKRAAMVLAAACALPVGTLAQGASPKCPASAETMHADLLGLWRAVLDGLPNGATWSGTVIDAAKTGARRQADLVRIVLTGPALFGQSVLHSQKRA